MKDAEQVAHALSITPETIRVRLAAVGLSSTDRDLLRAAAPSAEAIADEFLTTLYRRLRDYPDGAALLGSEAQVDRLKRMQRGYLDELFRSEMDWDYALRRLWVGVVHHRVRLAPQWYLTTYSHFVCDHLEMLFAASPSAAIAHEQAVVLLKTVFFDASLALDSYGRSEEAELWSRAQQDDARPAHELRADERAADGAGRPAAGPGSGYSRIRLTGECTLERRAFIGLTDEDIAELRTLRGLIERETPAVLDEFYEFLSGVPEMAALVPPATAVRLKQQVASYWLELVEGDFGRTHAASRMRIGVMHEKIGVGPQWYLAGLARQLAGFLRVLAAERPGAIAPIRALVRAVFFDLSFVIDAYMDARATTLMRTEGYANQLVAGLASAVAVVDGRDRLLSANRTLLSMIGGDPAVLFLMPVESAIPIPEAGRMLKALRDGGESRLVGAGKLGSRSLRITVMALSGHPGGEGTVALVVDDLTDLLRITSDLDSRTDHFEHLADSVGAVLWEMDVASWTITAINRAAIGLTGYRDLFLLGRPGAWLERIAEPDRDRFRSCARALRPCEKCELDYRIVRADGEQAWVRSRFAYMGEGDARRLVASTFDITASRRSHELHLEGIATIAGGVAHVVNNCLTGVLGNIELHASETGGLERSPLLAGAVASTRKAAVMAGRLLTFAGQHPLHPVPLSISAAVEQSLPRLQPLVGDAVRIRVELESEPWLCRLDPEMLDTALECLASNAAEALGGQGELVIRTRNVAGGEPGVEDAGFGSEWFELEFADDGVGMSESVRAHAIEPFFTTRSLAEASGLGLSMVHGFVTQSGGLVSLSSRPGEGTTIRLRFPRATSAAAAPRTSSVPSVLLVEDDEGIRRMTAGMIRRLGYRVHETGSVAEAVSLQRSLSPHVLVSDVVLGQGTDGVTLAQQLAAADPELAVILVSGYARTNFDLSSLPAGHVFLAKPFTMAQLGRCLAAVAPQPA